ncbi:MAG: HAMP domain-containing histidine kinase [Flavobacteriales bacterium]|nr:HAMP domain-containing histidine kinase [Flavobacteriales bacterium]
MKLRRTNVLVLGMGTLLLGLLALQFGWVRALVEARSDLFDEQARTALVEVQSVLALSTVAFPPPPVSSWSPSSGAAADSLAEVRAVAALEREQAMVVTDSLLALVFEGRGIDFTFKSALLDRYGRPIFLSDEDVDLLERFQNEGYRIPAGDARSLEQVQLYTVYFPSKRLALAGDMWIELTANLLLMIVLVMFTGYAANGLRKAEQLNRLKSDLINNMTHELKTPISTIGLAGEALLDDEMSSDPENLRYYVQLIRSENKRLGLLVENVLRAAMLDQGELELFRQPINFHDLVKEVLRNQAIHIKKQRGTTSTALQANDPVVTGDRTHLTNVVFNLVDNAIKYGGETPTLEVRSWNEGDSLHVAFVDFGIGIPREHLGKVFDKLYRVPTGNVHDVKGFGLGLSYVQAVMQQHGAEISVVSTTGEGSTFTLVFPQQKTTS